MELSIKAKDRRFDAQFDSLTAQRRGLLNRLESFASKRELTPAEQQSWDQLTAQIQTIDERLTALEKAMADDIQSETDLGPVPPMTNSKFGGSRLEELRRTAGKVEKRGWTPVGENTRRENDILRSWLRIGTAHETASDRQILETHGIPSGNAWEIRANTSAAGYGAEIIPTGFYDSVSTTLKAYSRVRDIAKVIQTNTGEALRLPKNDDTSNTGAIISPEVTDHTVQDLTFTEVQLGSFTYSSKVVKVSNELLNDNAIDLASFLGTQLGERIGRAQGAHFINGTGSGQPQGVVTGATSFSAASSSAIAINDLVGMVQAIDPAYLVDQGACYWLMNQQILGALRKLQDTLGRPLISSINDSSDSISLLGYPIKIAPEMDSTIASTKKSILFGNFNYYYIRDVAGLSVLRANERYFEQYATGFLAVYRSDAKVLQSGAFRVLTH